jgi:signal transduction histidine kinase
MQPLLWLIVVVFFSACSNFTSKEAELSDELKPIFKEYDSLDQHEQYKLAIQALDAGMAKVTPTDYDRLTYYQAKAGYYNQVLNNWQMTIAYRDSMTPLMELFPNLNSEQRGFYYVLCGTIASYQKNYDEAFLYFYKCKQLLDENKDYKSSQKYTNVMGGVLFKDGNYLAAASYFIESYKLALLVNDTHDFDYHIGIKQRALNNAGVSFETLGMFDSSLYYYNKALAIVTQAYPIYPDRIAYLDRAKGVIIGNIGGVLVKQKKYQEALPLLKESIQLNYREDFDINDAILTKIKLAALYFETGAIDSCRAAIKELESVLEFYPSAKARMRLSELKFKLNKQTANYVEALKNEEEFEMWRDSLSISTKRGYTRDNYLKYFEQAKNQVDLELLKRSNQLKNIYLGASILMGLLILAFWWLSKRKRDEQKKYIASLHELNDLVNISNQRLQQSLNSLEKTQEENKRMTKIIAHDLRSPVAAIMGLVKLLKVDHASKEDLEEYLNLAEKSGQKALDLIGEVLKTNIQQQAVEKKTLNLALLIDSCIQMNQIHTLEKGITVRTKLKEVWVEVNESNMWRVFSNLLSNAIKFSEPHSEILVYIDDQPDHVLIAFEDNGIGIPEAIQSKVFDMFTNAGRKGTNGEDSNGLGLAISKQIVEAHGGKIWFISNANKGSTFFVELPKGK